MNSERLMKPAEHAEHLLLTMILGGKLKPGQALPGERVFAEQLGVTRPTLRETLQRMAREGWFHIRHGKSTIVSDYMAEGGMGLLATLVKHGEYLPAHFIEHFLNIRCMFIPFLAVKAVRLAPESLQEYLENAVDEDTDSEAFMEYDWGLQRLMASLSGNPLYRMIMNDFNNLYRKMGGEYFEHEEGRKASVIYYRRLLEAVRDKDAAAVEKEVRRVMEEVLEIWQALLQMKQAES